VTGKTNSYFDTVNHIHLSDNNSEFDYHCPLGEGNINFKEVFNKFTNKGYTGIYVIEMNDREAIKKSLKYLKDIEIL
jgi:sugar phosphate isomerase/epimerase